MDVVAVSPVPTGDVAGASGAAGSTGGSPVGSGGASSAAGGSGAGTGGAAGTGSGGILPTASCDVDKDCTRECRVSDCVDLVVPGFPCGSIGGATKVRVRAGQEGLVSCSNGRDVLFVGHVGSGIGPLRARVAAPYKVAQGDATYEGIEHCKGTAESCVILKDANYELRVIVAGAVSAPAAIVEIDEGTSCP